MRLNTDFCKIKQSFFSRWDRDARWRVSTTSRRRVQGHCDAKRRVIEIVVLHADPDQRDGLLIHEICHAVVKGHGNVEWSRLPVAPMASGGTGWRSG